MKRIIFIFSLFLLFIWLFANKTFAQTPGPFPHDEFMLGSIIQIEEGTNKYSDLKSIIQTVHVTISSGKDINRKTVVQFDPQNIPDLKLHVGDTVVLGKTFDDPVNKGNARYYIYEKYRLPQVLWIFGGFLLLIVFITGKKGIGSIAGLIISFAFIFAFAIPQIIAGNNPLFIIGIAALGIMITTTYIAHGFSKQTTIALVATFTALLITFFLSGALVSLSNLSGYGTQDATDLHFGLKSFIDVKALLLGGIIIATLGALNDVTTTQAASIFQLAKSNPKLTFKELFEKGFVIGREHAISLVNTLLLAYTGSSFIIFIFFFYNPNNQPYWVILNNEGFVEEIMKTIIGTAGLLLVVPIVTFLASYYAHKEFKNKLSI